MSQGLFYSLCKNGCYQECYSSDSQCLYELLCLQCLASNVYIFVSQDGRCPAGGACYNISTFGKMADSFSNTTGLVVHFLEGTHLLDLT